MLKSFSLLIVEDNNSDVEALDKVLSNQTEFDIEILKAQSLEELTKFTLEEIDLCLLSLSIRESSGLDSIHEFLKVSKEIPFIVLSDEGKFHLDLEILRAGASDCISKAALNPQSLLKSIYLTLERYEVSKKLELKNKELSQFASMASHDLKAPLSRISMLQKLLDIDPNHPSSEENLEIVSKVQEQISEMAELIDSLQEYARALNKPLEFEMCSISEMIDICYEHNEKELMELGAKVKARVLPDIYGDKTLLSQVFHNLFNNSINYRSENTLEIVIDAEQNEDVLKVSFKDNGRGLKEDQLDTIFQAFKRFVSVNEIPGSGIGLTVCANNIQRHQGEIWAESDGSGEGLSIIFTLPNIQKSLG